MTNNSENPSENYKQHRLSTALWTGAGFILLMPFIAMQVTSEVNWDLADFVIFGIMLAAVCGCYELARRLTGNHTYRIAVALALLAAFLIIWINLAVGIIGGSENPANLMYVGVLGIGIIGALWVRFQAQGMSRVLVVMAIAQTLVASIVLMVDWDFTTPEPWVLLLMHGVFIILFLASAFMFHKAATQSLSTL
jgi:hypothetical protein